VSESNSAGDEQPGVDSEATDPVEPASQDSSAASTPSDEASPSPKPPLYKRPKTWIWAAVGLFAAWFVITLGLTALHAQQANKAINAMVDQIAAGDPEAAQIQVLGRLRSGGFETSAVSGASSVEDSASTSGGVASTSG
jgi:hypothetical protein